MKSALRFLIPYFIVYAVVAAMINLLYGPPGLSDEYRASYGADHDRYLAISKSPEYKLYLERPELHPPAGPKLAADFAFADEYQSREAYHEESHRRERYSLYLDVVRALMVVVLVLRFASAPLSRFLDGRVVLIREQLDHLAGARREARERHLAAERQMAELDAERARMQDEARARADIEAAKIAESTERALMLLAEEREDRIRNEELVAKRRVKRALVDEAIRQVMEEYVAARTAQSEAALVARFDEQMEQTR